VSADLQRFAGLPDLEADHHEFLRSDEQAFAAMPAISANLQAQALHRPVTPCWIIGHA
jgi:hypothetical protein